MCFGLYRQRQDLWCPSRQFGTCLAFCEILCEGVQSCNIGKGSRSIHCAREPVFRKSAVAIQKYFSDCENKSCFFRLYKIASTVKKAKSFNLKLLFFYLAGWQQNCKRKGFLFMLLITKVRYLELCCSYLFAEFSICTKFCLPIPRAQLRGTSSVSEVTESWHMHSFRYGH